MEGMNDRTLGTAWIPPMHPESPSPLYSEAADGITTDGNIEELATMLHEFFCESPGSTALSLLRAANSEICLADFTSIGGTHYTYLLTSSGFARRVGGDPKSDQAVDSFMEIATFIAAADSSRIPEHYRENPCAWLFDASEEALRLKSGMGD